MLESLPIVFGAVSTVIAVGGIVLAVIKWVNAQNRQSEELEALRKQHEADIRENRETEREDIHSIKNELCVLSYAMLAALDGLMQKGCNGNVTKAHESLERHLNMQAHGQYSQQM